MERGKQNWKEESHTNSSHGPISTEGGSSAGLVALVVCKMDLVICKRDPQKLPHYYGHHQMKYNSPSHTGESKPSPLAKIKMGSFNQLFCWGRWGHSPSPGVLRLTFRQSCPSSTSSGCTAPKEGPWLPHASLTSWNSLRKECSYSPLHRCSILSSIILCKMVVTASALTLSSKFSRRLQTQTVEERCLTAESVCVGTPLFGRSGLSCHRSSWRSLCILNSVSPPFFRRRRGPTLQGR